MFDWHRKHEESMSFGDRLADSVARRMGSWGYLIGQSVFVVAWMAFSEWLYFRLGWSFDPYPYILLNLLFSTQASYSAPVIMMAQNRQAARDRVQSEADHKAITLLLQINRRQEAMLRALHEHMGIEYVDPTPESESQP